ncbi:hypothetical protein B0H10DRAFT_917094 [Mycena sp. CBHHK59/15]|nr:hypothetical protein B0H10DRAFT_917094 [Mycena sp. CBHHK59/15]
MNSHLSDRTSVIGGGATGLVTAATLLADGFTDVTVFCSEKTAGGNWSTVRIYPGLVTNGPYYEFHSSAEDYTEEELKLASPTSGRLPARVVASYMERFAARRCSDCIQYQTRVTLMKRRKDQRAGWDLHVTDLRTNEESVHSFDKLVVCTGAVNLAFLHSSKQITIQGSGGPHIRARTKTPGYPRRCAVENPRRI